MSSSPGRARLPLVLSLLAGCFYAYGNPIEKKPDGTILGQIVITDAGPGAALAPSGATVGLLWTDLTVSVGAGGEFAFLGLPDGVYTLKYVLDAGGGPPWVGFRPGITLPREPQEQGGQNSDALNLGSIFITLAARVSGHVPGLDGGTAVVGAFAPAGDGGGGVFESFATTTDSTGEFTLDVPAGPHELWASSASQSGMISVSVPGGITTRLDDIVLAPPSSETNGDLLGDIVIGVPGFGAGADPVAVAAVLGSNGSNVEINPPLPASLSFNLSSQTVNLGAQLDQQLPPGQLGNVYCGLRAAQPPGPEVLKDILLQEIPAFAGHPTNLGQITWLPVGAFQENDAGVPSNFTASDAGPLDAGIGGWQLLGTIPFPVVTSNPVVIPIPGDAGPLTLMGLNGTIYAVYSSDAGFGPLSAVYAEASAVTLLAAGLDQLGTPTALATDGTTTELIQPVAGATSWQSAALNPATILTGGTAAIFPARPTGSGVTVGISEYLAYLDPGGQSVDLVGLLDGGLVPLRSVPSGNFGRATALAGDTCQGPGGDLAACLVITTSGGIFTLAIDPSSDAGVEFASIEDLGSASVQNPTVHTLPAGDVAVGWSLTTSSLSFQWADVPAAAFTCNPLTQSCPAPQVLTPSILPDNDLPKLLDLHGVPLVISHSLVAGNPTPIEAALLSADPNPQRNLPALGFLPTAVYGYDDVAGQPVIGLTLDAGSSMAAQVYTYLP